MNTHDKYELPPLPEMPVLSFDNFALCYHQMKQYGEQCARAAVEADRQRIEARDTVVRSSRSVDQLKEALKDRSQRFTASYSEVKNLIKFYEADRQARGEPVGERIIGEIKLDAKQHPYAILRTGYDENGNQWKEGTPIYATPQPQQIPTGPKRFFYEVGFEHGKRSASQQLPEGYKQTLREFLAALDKAHLLEESTSEWVNRPQGSLIERQKAWTEVTRLRAMLEAAPEPQQQAGEPVIEICDEGGHKFAKLPDHPTRDGIARCPHCLAIGLDAERQRRGGELQLQKLVDEIESLRSNDEDWDTSYWNQAIDRCLFKVRHWEQQYRQQEKKNATSAPTQQARVGGFHDCVVGDSNYAAGMLLGWNLCVVEDEETFNLVRKQRLQAAAQASKLAKLSNHTRPQPQTTETCENSPAEETCRSVTELKKAVIDQDTHFSATRSEVATLIEYYESALRDASPYKQAAEAYKSIQKQSKWPVLRAMARNYRGDHLWDHLDREVCAAAADEILHLRTLLETPFKGSGPV